MKKENILLAFLFGLLTFTGFAQEKFFNKAGNSKSQSVMELAQKDDRFSIFLSLLKASGMDTSMEYADGYTVFMPVNEAFGEMKLKKVSKLTDPDHQLKLVNFVKNYILPNKVHSYDFKNNQVIDLEGDKNIEITTDDTTNMVYIGGATIVQGDIESEDAVVHVINELITPTPEFMF
ncbi:MAG: fasciclin domain-containing protein [Sediminicola sp.]|tara:strand:+ start:34783 stop:35313 length:531 start_codon:yes stop_codon:yes gene_type:complete